MKKVEHLPAWLLELPVLVLGVGVFLALTLHQIDLPGLHTDEAMEVLPAVQLLRGQAVECYKDVCLEILGLRLPVMIYEYIAAVNAYLALPFFATLGISVPALRALPIAQSVVAMVFFYLLARELYNRRTATVAFLLLAVNPSFVFWSRQGAFVTSVTIPISMVALWSLWRWRQVGRARYLYWGAFLLGLGTSAKLLFGWVIAGIGVASVLLNLDRVIACLRKHSLSPLRLKLRWRDVAIAGSLFALGLLPLIIFNLETQSTIQYIRDNVFSSSYYDVDNTKLGENLRERIKELGSVVNGETFFYLAGRPYASWRYKSVFLLAVGVLTFSVLPPPTENRDKGKRRTLPTCVTVAGVIVPSYLILRFSGLEADQWYRLTPALSLPAAALAIALRPRARAGWRRWAGYVLVGLGAALLFMLFIYLSWKMAKWKSQWLYIASVLALLLAPWLRAREEARRALFPLLVLAVALVASCFTPTGLLFTHLALLTPWPILVVAVSADLIARRSGLDRIGLRQLPVGGVRGSDLGRAARRNRTWAAPFSLGMLALLALGGMLAYDDLKVDLAYHRDLQRVGGVGDHTSASYTLVQYLRDQGITDVAAMDWGIQDVVQFLSQGEINPPQLSSYEDPRREDAAFILRVQEQLRNPDTVYIFHIGPVFQNRWETFQQIVAHEGRSPVEEKIIYDRAAIPIFRLVRVPPSP